MNNYEIKARFTTSSEERKIIRDRLNLLTTPFGKKAGCVQRQIATTGGSAGLFSSHTVLDNSHTCRTSLNSKARSGNILNTGAGFTATITALFTAFDTFDSKSKLNREVKIW